jgi:hypothetical protein
MSLRERIPPLMCDYDFERSCSINIWFSRFASSSNAMKCEFNEEGGSLGFSMPPSLLLLSWLLDYSLSSIF